MDKSKSAAALRHGFLDILYAGTLPPHNGGSAIVGYQLLAGLANLGHTVRAIAPITAETIEAGARLSRHHPRISISWYAVPFFNSSPDKPVSSDYQNDETSAVVRAFENAISARSPDLLIIGRESFAWLLPDLARTRNLPSILLVHGAGLFGITQTSSSADRNHWAEQFRKVDLVVAVARHLEEPLRNLGLPRVVCISNPVDLAKFFPAPKDSRLMKSLGLRADSFVVVHISNLKRLKRTSDLVASAGEVIRCEPRTIYLVVGDGDCRMEMETACHRLGIADHFRFVGWVDHEEVANYINLADAVVMPSESEAMALVYLETLACGRLLIASDIPAAREVIGDSESGLLFRRGDSTDLTRKILLAANDQGLRGRIGAAARERARQFGLDHFVAAYDRVIRQLAPRSAR
jgi:glycosyltransferase involved in cell wall biosynthesis